MANKLPIISEDTHYQNLKKTILGTISDVHKQMVRVEKVFEMLGAAMSAVNCPGMVGMIEETFQAIKRHKGRDHRLRDLAIANYTQQIESVELSALQMEMAVVKIKDKQIKNCLKKTTKHGRTVR